MDTQVPHQFCMKMKKDLNSKNIVGNSCYFFIGLKLTTISMRKHAKNQLDIIFRCGGLDVKLPIFDYFNSPILFLLLFLNI